METRNLEPLLSDPDVNTTEVLIGLDPDSSQSKLEAYMGDDGQILKNPGFDIYRVRLTKSLLADFVASEPAWVDYIEHAGEGIVALFETENLEINSEF